MRNVTLWITIIFTLLIAACSPAAATPAGKTDANGYPLQAAPTTSAVNSAQGASTSAYPVNATDADKLSDPFAVTKMELRPNAETAGYTDVWASGSMPSECHRLAVKITPPTKDNQIAVDVFVLKPTECSSTAAFPFEGVVASLGGYPAGKYTVMLNGKSAGEVNFK